MPDQHRPLSKEQAPDTARVYERAQPEKEGGMGRLDNNKATPAEGADGIEDSVQNKQNPQSQLNGEDSVEKRAKRTLSEVPGTPNPDQRTHRHVK